MESLESTTPNSPEAWIRRPEAWTDHRPWLERFREMVAALEAHPLITVTTLMIAPPATEEEIAAARAYHPIPAALEALYRQSNGVTLRWNAKECGDRVMGSIRILPVEETFTSQEYSIWEDVEEDSETLSLHPVDYFEPEAYVAIHLKEGVDRGMWYGTIEDCDDLKLSLEAYLEVLLRTRGYFYWPKAVAADVRGRSGNSDANLLRMWMPRLFADYDEQVLFRGRYAEAAAAASSARQARMATIRSALEAAGVDFESRDDGVGTINIHFPNTPENNGRLAAGAKTLGVDLSDEGWHVRQIGSLVFHKETA